MPLAPGRRLGPYEIVAAVGAGGMGEVYRAVDTRLGRAVALKVLAGTETSAEGRRRLTREARAVAALNHPHICTLHDIGTEDDLDYIVMELLEGETLRARLAGAAVPDDDVLRIAVELAGALAAAHRAGLTHGDLKPGNVMLTRDGAKLLDFGLSRRVAAAAGDATRTAQGTLRFGLAGTPGSMAPEQFQGKPAGMRTDVWALGTVIAEMLGSRTGPPGLQAIVERARAVDPAARYPSAAEMLDDLVACTREFDDRRSGSLRSRVGRRLRQPAGQLILVAAMAVIALTVTWAVQRNARIAEARRQLTELARLADAEEYGAAFALARRLEQVIPHDPTLNAAWSSISETGEVVSDPPGARVSFKPYRDTTGEWIALGSTPVKNARLPLGLLRVRAEKPGYDTLTIARTARALLRGVKQRLQVIPRGLQLTRTGEESGMVRIGGTGRYAPFLFHGLPSIPEVDLPEYYLDRHEVTNREFKAFVDAGGYVRPEYWRHAFVRHGKPLSWQDAVRIFVDRTGRAGPSTWELGDYPPGQGDLPVAGVSWFEAAAYAAHVRKELPTMYHWIRAASPELAHEILPLSNVPGPQQVSAGPVRVASFEGISLHGAVDVAGNVKEWCLNEAEPGRRLALGGAWDEPEYMFHTRDSRDAFDRSPNLGFRCARYARERLPREALAAVPEPPRTYDDLAPAADETFEVYRGIYAYDAAPLEARVEATEEDPGG